MPDEASARLEKPLLKTREGPALNGNGQDEPTPPMAKVVGDDAEQEVDFIGRKRCQERRIQWVASVPSLIYCSAGPRWLEKQTTARFVPVSVVTMEPTRGNRSPR